MCAGILFLILLTAVSSLQAQVRVTGHVFAEIVEPTALSAKANNSHFIETAKSTSANELVIAQVKLSGGVNMNIDVAVQTTHLEAANGQTFPFNAFACPECSDYNQHTNAGEKVFTLKATPGESLRKEKNNTYNGRYSVVFMYN
ncbi:MAG: hypothetical protein ACOC0R_03690 [Mariniphaga sp.]